MPSVTVGAKFWTVSVMFAVVEADGGGNVTEPL
jgi:hypothetical protein